MLKLGLLLLALPALAATDLSSFDTLLHIQNNGSVVVVEHIMPETPTSHIVWSTATEYPGDWSVHRPRLVKIYQVTTIEGAPLTYTTQRRDGRLELDINSGGASGVRLVYEILNAVEFLSDHDRLLWNPGEGWRGKASNVTVFIWVPQEAAQDFHAQAYLRGRGLLPVHESSAGNDRISFVAEKIAAQDRMMVDVALAPGVLHQRSALQRAAWFVSANSIVLLPIVVLLVMLVWRRAKALPVDDSSSIVSRYDAPAGLTPAEIGVLVDDSLDPRDITATLIDLAVRKYVRLEQCTPDEGVDFSGQDFVLRLLRPIAEWKDLQPHEQTVLFNTFYGGEWTKLSSLTLRFYPIVPGMRAQIGMRLRLKGYYWTDPQNARWLRLANVLLLGAILFVVQLAGWFSFTDSWLLSLISVGVSALIVHLLGSRLTAKTRKGLQAYREIIGFREFLNSVDRDRLERLPADLFERCLPYAIALGVEHHWAGAFSGVALGPPEWFTSEHPELFTAARLARVIDLFAKPKGPTLPVQARGFRARG